MYEIPVKLSRPSRTSDTYGGSVTVAAVAGQTIWIDPIQGEPETLIAVHPDEDVRIGDMLAVNYNLFSGEASPDPEETQVYRVKSLHTVPGQPWRMAKIEITKRPTDR